MVAERLPEFAAPPVVEVALAVQLIGDIGYRSVDLAKIAAPWTTELPEVQELPALPTMDFFLDEPEATWNTDSTYNNTPRLWFRSEDRTRVLQIQQDRIIVNWQKVSHDDPYPRYVNLRGSLTEAWSKLEAVVGDVGLAMPAPWLCEVLYVNHIDTDHLVDVIAPWSGKMSDDFLPGIRDEGFHEGFHLHYHLPDVRGWLEFDGWTRHSDAGEKMMVLTVASRGWARQDPQEPAELEDALEFMDLAHEWIVKGFASITTPDAHKTWRRAP